MDNELLNKLDKAGYSMFNVEEDADDVNLLINVLKSNDLRLWHMFPAIFANVYNRHKVNFDIFKSSNNGMELLKFSFDVYKYEYPNSELFYDLKGFFDEYQLNNFYNNNMLNTQRGRNLFNQYFRPASKKIKDLLPLVNDFQFEYALSEIFSAKQRQLHSLSPKHS